MSACSLSKHVSLFQIIPWKRKNRVFHWFCVACFRNLTAFALRKAARTWCLLCAAVQKLPDSHNLWLSACRLFYRPLTNFPVLLHLPIHPSILLYIYPLFVSLFIHQLILLTHLFLCIFLIYSRTNVALFVLILILLFRYRLNAVLLLTGTTNERVSDRNHVDFGYSCYS
jgi:hypothetical protein